MSQKHYKPDHVEQVAREVVDRADGPGMAERGDEARARAILRPLRLDAADWRSAGAKVCDVALDLGWDWDRPRILQVLDALGIGGAA